MAKKQEINPNEQMAADILQLQEDVKILSDAVTSLVQQGLRVNLSDEQLQGISKAAANGITEASKDIRIPAPDLSAQVASFADQVSSTVLNRVGTEISKKVDGVMKGKKIPVENYHRHYSMYGAFASSEKNRKTMAWLGIITFVSLVEIVLNVLIVYDKINWNYRYLLWAMMATIPIAVIGFLIRVFSPEVR